MASIDYYFGTVSPWAYLAGDRLERIAERHGASITYRPLDLPALYDRTGGIRAELYPDEAQYWLWSRTLDFGYFSKPPMVAWTIRL